MISCTRRRLLRHKPLALTVQQALDQLQFPWLCPALFDHSWNARSTFTAARGARLPLASPESLYPRPQLKTVQPVKCSIRTYAYATEIQTPFHQEDSYVPFEKSPGHRSPDVFPATAWQERPDFTKIRMDPSSPLIIRDSLSEPSMAFRLLDGIGGEPAEMYETLLACLHVGRFERAAAVLRRLNEVFKPEAPELIELHNEYLAHLVETVAVTKDQSLLQEVQVWYTREVRAKNIPPNSITIAYMIRASLQQLDLTAMPQMVSQHMRFAESKGFSGEVIEILERTLRPTEFGLIRDILPLRAVTVDDQTEISKLPNHLSSENVFETAQATATSEQGAISKPYIKPTKQKGLGLDTLVQSLSLFDQAPENSTQVTCEQGNVTEEQRQASNQARQRQLEQNVLQAAIQRWRQDHIEQQKKLGSSTQLHNLGGLIWEWHNMLLPLVNEEIKKANDAEAVSAKGKVEVDRVAYGPFLQYIPPETIVAVTVLTVLGGLTARGGRGAIAISSLMTKLGNAIADESMVHAIRTRTNDLHERRRFDALQNAKKLAAIRRKYSKSNSQFLQEPMSSWTIVTKHKVAALLVSLFFKTAKMEVTRVHPKTGQEVTEVQAAVFHSYVYKNGKRIGILKGNPELMKRLTKEPFRNGIAKALPMLVAPVPWTGWKSGGYLSHPVAVVRIPPGSEQSTAYIRAASKNGDMAQVFAGLDVLGRTAWKINRSVFQVMVEAWNSGVAIANFQPADPKIEYPPEPEDRENRLSRWKWIQQIQTLENALQGSHTQRCFHNFQLEIARAYLDETFYFPHTVDFRGRAYPIPPYLNQLGADHCRGLLLFAKGKPLGAAGLAWLKVHLANVFGYDKASLSERRQFAEDHIADIRDSATNSLDGSRWWLKAEDPWQCLATCMELTRALDSPDPTAFVCHLPVHQDGTCNGLQHYAALGGDPIGAAQVNLEPGDRPADVYTGVADMVIARLQEEALKGNQYAKMLEGHIKRKVVKQTVMTNVYGVTFAGAIAQVKRQIRSHMMSDTSKVDLPVTELTLEVVSAIFQSLGTMFQGATAIQHWLVECANRISCSLSAEQIEVLEDHERGIYKDPETPYLVKKKTRASLARFRTSVIWTTPLKMPVVQPYRKVEGRRTLKTSFQTLLLEKTSASDTVAKKKQLQAFPPNFIHSLDATHMFLTAIKCEEVGLTFASVHDSFWTHPCDVDIMNRILREAFIRLHSDDIIGRLAAEFTVRYKGYMYRAPIRMRSSVGEKITELRKARYGRKIGRLQDNKIIKWQAKELIEEHKRLRLLASENPEERAMGEAMVTPGKIFSETQNPDDFLIPEEVPNALGSDLGDGIEATTNIGSTSEVEEDLEGTLSDVAGLEAESDGNEELEVATQTLDARTMRMKQVEAKKRARKERAALNAPTFVWIPICFPPVPPKGSFDIKKLIKSQYFFS